MKITGKVHEIGQTQRVSDTFSKRNIVLEYAENPTYPEYVNFELLQDKTALADEVEVGEEITVEFNLRGRPWTDKAGKTSYFNSLVIWRIDGVVGTNEGGEDNGEGGEEGSGDLPF